MRNALRSAFPEAVCAAKSLAFSMKLSQAVQIFDFSSFRKHIGGLEKAKKHTKTPSDEKRREFTCLCVGRKCAAAPSVTLRHLSRGLFFTSQARNTFVWKQLMSLASVFREGIAFQCSRQETRLIEGLLLPASRARITLVWKQLISLASVFREDCLFSHHLQEIHLYGSSLFSCKCFPGGDSLPV